MADLKLALGALAFAAVLTAIIVCLGVASIAPRALEPGLFSATSFPWIKAFTASELIYEAHVNPVEAIEARVSAGKLRVREGNWTLRIYGSPSAIPFIRSEPRWQVINETGKLAFTASSCLALLEVAPNVIRELTVECSAGKAEVYLGELSSLERAELVVDAGSIDAELRGLRDARVSVDVDASSAHVTIAYAAGAQGTLELNVNAGNLDAKVLIPKDWRVVVKGTTSASKVTVTVDGKPVLLGEAVGLATGKILEVVLNVNAGRAEVEIMHQS